MSTLSNINSILSLYRPIDPVWGDITQLLKPTTTPTPTPTISPTPPLGDDDDAPNKSLFSRHIPNAPATTQLPSEDKLKESWNKGREYGLQEAAMRNARRVAAALAGMRVVIRTVVDIPPFLEYVEDVATEEEEVGREVVVWTPETSNKDTDEEEVEEGDDLLELEVGVVPVVDVDGDSAAEIVQGGDQQGIVSGGEDNKLFAPKEVKSVEIEEVNIMTVEGDLGLGFDYSGDSCAVQADNDAQPGAITVAPSKSFLNLTINTAETEDPSSTKPTTLSPTLITTPTDTLLTRFNIPSPSSTIQLISPNFYKTRIIPPYPLNGETESPDALLLGPISPSALEEWKLDHGRRYIMDKVRGVFSTVLLEDDAGKTYIRVEFHSRQMRDIALRVFGGVVDEREGPLFVKGGYPCGGTIMFAWKWRDTESM
ncbi:hypothetical protein B0T21DRAFT_417108 [Apiosordaria backusii]|uniref:Uncharacterized protein n=1 Tax=Apiosordaria backusii TaxID=314023 RepID=A0AA39ZQ73_9PEZI|nr:hypothetical protein B0T21DRAFT_417108 [Apiosordaria backusii]